VDHHDERDVHAHGLYISRHNFSRTIHSLSDFFESAHSSNRTDLMSDKKKVTFVAMNQTIV
jgi:hypothetical protein